MTDAQAGSKLPPILQALRPHQWVKNLLVFAPLVLGQQGGDRGKLIAGALAFVAFSLTASGIYVVNDLFDVEADRSHPTKRLRPFASGALPIRVGPPLAAGLFLAAAAVSFAWLNRAFALALGVYVALSLAYSMWLKRELMVDVLALTALYVMRILAGAYATETHVTEWLLAFAVFLFTSLAFAKRYTEITRTTGDGSDRPVSGRAYDRRDLSVIESVGPTSGYLAVLVLALYINSDQVTPLYANPVSLWLVCPVLLYWITRLWFFAKRGELHDDPVVFALTDRTSLFVGLLAAALVFLAVLGPGPTLP